MRKKLKILKRAFLDLIKNSKGQFSCPVCRTKAVSFNPIPVYYFSQMHKFGFKYNIFQTETLNIEHYTCSKCGASDRDRLYALFLEKYFNINSKNIIKLLDIAPATNLRTYILHHQNVSYRSMDLYMKDVDDNLDITNMNLYKDGQFDFFICSHVLEHIPDDIKSMQELYRILKKGGKGIAMVPINLGLDEIKEDPLCEDIAVRWREFGQDDHIRAYSKRGFISRLESVGFNVELLDIHYFGKEIFELNGIFPTSVLYIVTK